MFDKVHGGCGLEKYVVRQCGRCWKHLECVVGHLHVHEDRPTGVNGQIGFIRIIIIKKERTKSCDNYLRFAMQDKLETDHPIFYYPERMTQVMLDHLKSKNSTKVFPTLSQGSVIIQSNKT